MHAANQKTNPQLSEQFVNWNKQSKAASLDQLPKDERQLPELRQRLEAIFSGYPKTPANFGIIHYDVHQGNYLLEADRINLFDFEMVCPSWYENDIAVALYYAHFFNQRIQQFPEKEFQRFFLEFFLLGYRK
jgi:Ser/Thr protein kinase RdoA (MazF antagonist)